MVLKAFKTNMSNKRIMIQLRHLPAQLSPMIKELHILIKTPSLEG